MFALAILFLVGVCINLSIHVSRPESRLEALAQEVAFLRGPVGAPIAEPKGDAAPAPEMASGRLDADPDVSRARWPLRWRCRRRRAPRTAMTPAVGRVPDESDHRWRWAALILPGSSWC